jgi:hypothetical protein
MKRSRFFATIFAVITIIGAAILSAPPLKANYPPACAHEWCYGDACQYELGFNCFNGGGGNCSTAYCYSH